MTSTAHHSLAAGPSADPGRQARSVVLSRVGRGLVSGAALFQAIGNVTADWSDSHLFNPDWSTHAKFHVGQTMTLAVLCAGVTLWLCWRPGAFTLSRLRWATLFGGLFWVTMAPAAFYPGAGVVDPDSAVQPLSTGFLPVNQVTVVGSVVLVLLAAGYRTARRTLPPSRG